MTFLKQAPSKLPESNHAFEEIDPEQSPKEITLVCRAQENL